MTWEEPEMLVEVRSVIDGLHAKTHRQYEVEGRVIEDSGRI